MQGERHLNERDDEHQLKGGRRLFGKAGEHAALFLRHVGRVTQRERGGSHADFVADLHERGLCDLFIAHACAGVGAGIAHEPALFAAH